MDHEHDAEGVKPGEWFGAHAVENEGWGPDQVVRSDDAGRGDVLTRGLSGLGAALLGCVPVGFAARVRMAPGRARHALGTWWGIGALASATL